MELMDDSLTHFLESSPQPIPYHIQVNVCHDITLALSFLHSNGIVHRDLSSNNVLLIGNVRAKVTDFGMARLGIQNPQLTFTLCPGTDVYMPPESVKDKPVYTEKIDCFSFGVITVQTITRQFPKPGVRRKRIQINQPGLPPIVEVPISEIARRQNHIGEIDPNHTLVQVALDCLRDEDVERPSAQQLCERLAALKQRPQYSESVRVVEARSTAEQERRDKRDRELRSLKQQYSQQQQTIQSQTNHLAKKVQTIAKNKQIIAQNSQILREKDETIAELKQQTQHAVKI
jgi:serine/threonine-protein kinase TNNI3K